MARKSKDKFHVGQEVVLVLDAYSGWQSANGEIGVVIGPKRRDMYMCSNLDGSGPSKAVESERYAVRWKGGTTNFCEYQLRAIYEGEPLSTWTAFERVTGLRLDGRSRRRRRNTRTVASE